MNIKDLHLLYNAAAHFAAQEKYPDGLISAMSSTGKEGFDALCWAVVELSTQGELCRRAMGHDKAKLLTLEQVSRQMLPRDIVIAKQAVLDAVIKGLRAPEEDENAEVDEVLAELEKKTGAG